MRKVKIMSWGLQFSDSTILHALPDPTDIGDHGPAVCGHGSARGWSEPQGEGEFFWCNPCVTELERLYQQGRLNKDTIAELRALDLIT
jgi:hypothetical protein